MNTFIRTFVILNYIFMIRYNSAWTANFISKQGIVSLITAAVKTDIKTADRPETSAKIKYSRFVSTILGFGVMYFQSSLPVIADSSWTDRNRLAAETWRAVDEGYLDRTFGGQDWFKLRKEVVKKDYKSDEELYQSLTAMLSKLGDKYTRKNLLIQIYIRIRKIRSCSIKAF